MTQTYQITGMTCNGCKAAVEDALNSLKGVSAVVVDLEHSKAEIESSQGLTLDELKKALPKKYRISTLDPSEQLNLEGHDLSDSKLKQLFPLFLIFGYLFTAAILININPWNSTGFMLDFMGLFYIVFSFFKLLDLRNFPNSFKMYDPIAKRIPAYGFVYPFIETSLGLMFLFRFNIEIALIITLVILGATTIGVVQSLLNKQQIQCACLGTVLKLPMTQATFIENAIMLVMALVMLFNSTAL